MKFKRFFNYFNDKQLKEDKNVFAEINLLLINKRKVM